MLINNHSNQNIEKDFQLILNQVEILRIENVKHLGLYIDDQLKLTHHIKYLTLQLARYSGNFYRIRKLVLLNVLHMLYFSIIHSRLQYGVILWRTTYDYIIKEIETIVENVDLNMLHPSSNN